MGHINLDNLEGREKILAQDPYNPTCLMNVASFGTKYFKKLDIIKRFRDDFILKRGGVIGRNLVRAYYKISSFVCPIIEKSEILKKIVLNLLVKPLIRINYNYLKDVQDITIHIISSRKI